MQVFRPIRNAVCLLQDRELALRYDVADDGRDGGNMGSKKKLVTRTPSRAKVESQYRE